MLQTFFIIMVTFLLKSQVWWLFFEFFQWLLCHLLCRPVLLLLAPQNAVSVKIPARGLVRVRTRLVGPLGSGVAQALCCALSAKPLLTKHSTASMYNPTDRIVEDSVQINKVNLSIKWHFIKHYPGA